MVSALTLVLVIAATAATPARPATRPTLDRAGLEALVNALGSDEYEARRTAQLQLMNLPRGWYPTLQEILKQHPPADAEIRMRLEPILPMVDVFSRREKQRLQGAMCAPQCLARYAKVGKTKPAWDEAAKRAIALVADGVNLEDGAGVAALREACQKADEADCDDALYLVARSWNVNMQQGSTSDAAKQAVRDAAHAMDAQNYPPLDKMPAFAEYAAKACRPRNADPDADAYFTKAFTLLQQAAAAGGAGFDAASTRNSVKWLHQAMVARGKTEEQACDALFDLFVKACPKSARPYAYKGGVYHNLAATARGSDIAARTTQQQFQNMEKYIAVAKAALEAGYQVDPDDEACPTEMVGAANLMSLPRQDLEIWFDRAMKAWPDNGQACYDKLYYLLPQWHGSYKELMNFGNACLESGNCRGRIVFILVDIHAQLRLEGADVRAYDARPEVWHDIDAAYKTYLAVFPDSILDRTRYAKYACRSEQWQVAHEQFEILGDHPAIDEFGSMPIYNYYRRTAERLATSRPTKAP